MPDETELTVADFYEGLSPEDVKACFWDRILYGSAWARMNDDGTRTRIPPEEHPGMTAEDHAKQKRIMDAWNGRVHPAIAPKGRNKSGEGET